VLHGGWLTATELFDERATRKPCRDWEPADPLWMRAFWVMGQLKLKWRATEALLGPPDQRGARERAFLISNADDVMDLRVL
jgi:hypothetical protein